MGSPKMPITKSFCLACSILSVVPCVLLGADPPAAKDSGHVRLALLRAVPVKWDLDANFKTFLIATVWHKCLIKGPLVACV